MLARRTLLVVLGLTVALTLYALLVIAPRVATQSAGAEAQVRALLARRHGVFLTVQQIGLWLPRATLATEDRRFYDHGAVDLRATARALWFDLRGGRPLQGGATIDAQLAKRLLHPIPANPVLHALDVLFLAQDLDQDYGKQGVLTLYLNDIYYGSGAYGAGAAARIFFGVPPPRLTVTQAAFLAGLPNAPAVYGDHPASLATRARWLVVLRAMATTGDLTAAQAQRLIDSGPPGAKR